MSRIDRRTYRAAGMAVIALGLATSLTSCSLIAATTSLARNAFGGSESKGTPGGTEKPAKPEKSKQFSPPVAPDGAWLHQGYAKGIGGTWVTQDTLCGISGDSSVAITSGITETSVFVAATDLKSGKELWKRDQARCDTGAVTDDAVLFAARNDLGGGNFGFTAELAEIDSGKVTAKADMTDGELASVQLYGEDDDRVYFAAHFTGSSAIFALAEDGKVTWKQPIPAEILASECVVLDGALGCNDYQGAWVLDAATGEKRFDIDEFSEIDNAWAYDGYIAPNLGSTTGMGSSFYDLDNTRVGKSDLRSSPPLLPAAANRAFFKLDSFAEWSAVAAIDEDGAPVITKLDRTGIYTFAKSGVEVPDMDNAVSEFIGVSRDGGVIAFAPSVLGDEVQLLDAKGKQVGSIAKSLDVENMTGDFTSLTGGLLATLGDAGTTVHLPEGF